MCKSIENYIRECIICAERKAHVQPKKAPQQSIDVGELFTFWAMDYLGPISETVRGNKYIFWSLWTKFKNGAKLYQLKTKRPRRSRLGSLVKFSLETAYRLPYTQTKALN